MSKKRNWESLGAIAMVASYVPRRCGIATFTADLTEAIAGAAPDTNTCTVALNDRPEGYRYPPRVWFEINENRLGEYRLAADFLNMSNVDVCCIQHEFGIFGGKAGSHILEFIKRLRMPVTATLHTVLAEPEQQYRDAMDQLVEHCDRLFVMADRAYDFLTDIYNVPKSKIQLIHHGIPDVPFVDPNFFKDHFGVEGRKVVLTFGLLGPSKGIENMIDALPAIVQQHPDVVYMVLGATHPGVLREHGEEYRLGLKQRAESLGVADNIQFINKFVETDELVEYLGAADVYVTPYHNEAQITSGTLAYALGTGKATVSTPYWYAQEMLADGRGQIVPFQDTKALADAVVHLFDNEIDRHAMRKRAYQFTRQMRWRDVAGQYLDAFQDVVEDRHRNPRPAVQHPTAGNQSNELSEIKLDHLMALTDSVGVFQRAKCVIPERAHGYTTIDNARALIVAVMAQDHVHYGKATNLDRLITTYLSFLQHAFDEDSGKFYEQMTFDRQWLDKPFSEEAHGSAIWGLGEAVARCQTRGQISFAVNLLHGAMPICEKFEYLHGIAYSLIGIHAYLRRFGGDSHARRVREQLAKRLLDRFRSGDDHDWNWPTDKLTYANARIAQAMLLSGRWMFDNEMVERALRSLEWLCSVQADEHGRFAPVGTDGWFRRGGERPRFDQKPTEATSTIDACLEAYRVTEEKRWLDRANQCMLWFLGDNDLRVPLADPTTGGCADALQSHGVNENQGAEATTSWLLALLSHYEQNLHMESGSASISNPEVDAQGNANPAKPASGRSGSAPAIAKTAPSTTAK